MSEQWQAPHMLTQQASATRSFAGSVHAGKVPVSSSITAFTSPEASVAAEWQWIQPWVCTMLLTALPDAADRKAGLARIGDERLDFRGVGEQEFDVMAAREPQVALAVLVRQIAD